MHREELWQEYDHTGERLDSGRPPARGNPPAGDSVYVASANVWLYRRTENGIEVLFQHRSPYVDGFPDKWDRSAGGHINLGEKNIDAVVRETREEIGVDVPPEKFHFVNSFLSNFTNMIANVYACDYTDFPDDFHFDDKEVSEVRWVPLSEFDNFMLENAKRPLAEDIEVNALFKKWLEARGNN